MIKSKGQAAHRPYSVVGRAYSAVRSTLTGSRFGPATLSFTSLISRLRQHKPLFLVLLIFSLFTLYNSISLPLGEAADETDHYQYLRFVARAGHPPLTETERKEAGFKGGLAPLYYWLTAWPITWIGESTPPDIRRVDARPERFIPTDGLGINHVLHTLDERRPWHGQVLAWHLVRFLSLPMAWVTLIAIYALARRLVPEQKFIAVAAVAFAAFLPRFVSSSAVINDDNLVFALVALLLLTQVLILQGDHRPRTFAILGALFGLALLTKYFSLILIPEILLTLFLYQGGRLERPPLIPRLRAFLLGLFLIAGPWYIFIILRFNRIDELGFVPGLVASLGEPQITGGLIGLLSGQPVRPPAATYAPLAWLGLLYRSFWFEFGWMKIFAPTWVYALFTIFLIVACTGFISKIKFDRPTLKPNNENIKNSVFMRPTHYPLRTPSPIPWLLALHLILFVVVLLVRYALSATIDTGQGRHLYPALPVIALLVATGWHRVSTMVHDDLQSLISKLGWRSWSHHLLPAAFYLLLTASFMLPAAVSLLPSSFVLPNYRLLPITVTAPANLTVSYPQSIPVTDEFFLAGFEVGRSAVAGDAVAVTLYWRVINEVNQDYLVSLCLQDEAQQSVACWRGQVADGHYPTRAWEAGDTVADTVFIPIPTCFRLEEKPYRLHLEVWPLRPDSLKPTPDTAPALQQTFFEPPIFIRPTETLFGNPSQTVDLWQRSRRLVGPVNVQLNEAVTQITYSAFDSQPQPAFTPTGRGKKWLPLAQFNTPLFLPCADGPIPFASSAHFIGDASLSLNIYRPDVETPANVTLALFTRIRSFEPVTTTLSFDQTLAPLLLNMPGQPAINLTGGSRGPAPYVLIPASTSGLPVTIRWQAWRWMADPLVVSIKLLDKDFGLGGERIATLGDRYPNVLWAPTEIVEESYPLRLKPDAPPGLYRLEISLVRQDKNLADGFEYLSLVRGDTHLGPNLYPIAVRLLDPAHDTLPSRPFRAQIGEAIHLIGYDLPPQSPVTDLHSPIFLTLYWQSTGKIAADYTVFTQLLGPDGQVWAQWDNPPQAGRYPTSAWAENDTVVDRYNLLLREGAPAGDYRVLVGMYDPRSGQRLTAALNGQPQPDNAIELTTLTIAAGDRSSAQRQQ